MAQPVDILALTIHPNRVHSPYKGCFLLRYPGFPKNGDCKKGEASKDLSESEQKLKGRTPHN